MAGAFTFRPPSKGTKVPLWHLIDGLSAFLETIGFACTRFGFEPSHPTRDLPRSSTAVQLHSVVESGQPWPEGRYIFFDIFDKACRSSESLVGPDPIEMLLTASSVWDKTVKPWRCIEEPRFIVDVTAYIQADKSLSFVVRNPPRHLKGGYIIG